jgi:branched-chain amino acid transport system substrate-binding protein
LAGTLACAILTLGFGGAVTAQEPASIKVGYAISKTGPNAGGANITQIPNYQLWVKEVNDKGGLMVGGKRVKIEVIEYDDRSSSEEAVKAVERPDRAGQGRPALPARGAPASTWRLVPSSINTATRNSPSAR